jgi:topoisomerase-4 subunit A
VRARWKIEDLARGQWQLVVHELPPGTSSQKVLEEIEELTNPKVKTGKKALSADQVQLKATRAVGAGRCARRVQQGCAGAPGLRAQEPHGRAAGADHHAAGAHQPGVQQPINLTMVGRDGRPTPEEPAPDAGRVDRLPPSHGAAPHPARLQKVLDRIHVLEGRQLVLLNIDEVIRIIRNADEPKPALIERFALSDRQAEDILEIRLRQLARLEAIKIEQELKGLREDQGRLEDILGSPATLKRTVIKEIEADAKPVRRRPPHPDPGREEGGGRDPRGRRTGDRGRQPEGLGAGAQGP